MTDRICIASEGNQQKCPKDLYPTNTCEHKCQDNYTSSYDDDKHYGSVYAVAQDVSSIQKEIMNHGPVEVAFDVYEDFEHYSSGIYKYTAGEYLGGHAVKMLGWGTENGVDYWICANSWNSDWGENGFFRILRGENECGIESSVVAGEPK
ncbi:peptidyl-prolyl cis-trans isomerase cpr6 [Parelaphostrongylus tenuis]|uniref:Peptidyl-prolyl cis-trans isomerase cpr6 n=1 Tax=Parelaphostrongylus tenuis TaxID=148309 RepID=A0AAD5QVY5_PARTN|nr:peptidyl-prolyl cis-trans isomerase cpr6 [Parelaphostrongylus tenuis]